MERFVIYGLTEPDHGELRYVGKSTTGLQQRVASHLCPSSLRPTTRKNGWLKSLLKSGKKPEAFVIEVCGSASELNEAERHHIATFKAMGCRLTNGTPGGDGQGRECSKETREKLSKAQRGKSKPPWSAERRARPSPNLGRKRSPESIALTAAARIGMKQPESARKVMQAAAAAYWGSADSRSAQSIRKGGGPIRTSDGRVFVSQQEASRVLSINVAHINGVLKGYRKSAGGLSFSYVMER